jgi:ABC-type lipoprotein release transport system permease subunit
LPDSRPILRAEILRTYDAVFHWREGMVVRLPGRAAAGVRDPGLGQGRRLSAEEKREIGILKAIGWETGDILRMKLWEGALLSLTAFLAGYRWPGGRCSTAAPAVRAGVEGLGGAVSRLSADASGATLIPTAVDLQQILVLLAVTVLPYIVATLIPGWRAAIVDPDAAMRG